MYVQPKLDAFTDDIRLLSTTQISFAVLKRLGFSIGLEIAWDSNPPVTLDALDSTMTFGVVWKF